MGGSNKSVTVGYKYYLTVHSALCHGPVDAVTELIVGERTAWLGNVTNNSQITVSAENLFGGTKREGGVSGKVDIMMGGPTQAKNDHLMALRGVNIPAYRGIVSTVFRNFYWAAMNPYFKAPWWRVKRILQGWSTGSAWHPTKAAIGAYDMNPAHIIYQCLTDTEWGMGYSASDIGASFTTAADKLHAENFGLSILWSEQASIQDFIGIILDHINGTLSLDQSTGKFELNLVRDDYVVGDLPLLDPSNIIELRSFQRAAWGDTANEVTVIYTGRDEGERSITVQDPASIEAQGGVVSSTREYRGIREDNLAVRVAMRDLNTAASPLSKVSLICNRIAWDWNVGSVFALSWPRLGLTLVPMRIVSINKGTLVDGKVEIEAVEDIFGLPSAVYTDQPPSGWVDPISQPTPVSYQRAIEAPYWEIVQNFSAADLAYMEPMYGYGQLMAVKPTTDAYNFILNSSPTSGGVYSEIGSGDFAPSGTLASAMGMPSGSATESVILTNPSDMDMVDVGGYGYIDDEAVQVVSYNETSGELVVRRGVLDTVPKPHAAGARFYFSDDFTADDRTQRVSGESVWYKALTQTGYGTLSLSSAISVGLTFNNRATRPYPPGQFKINNAWWPGNVSGGLIVTWAHRDRLQQTATLVDYSQGNIGPEVGTTYTMRVYQGATLKRTYSGISGLSQVYSDDHVISDGLIQTLRITLTSVVGGVESWQPHDHTVERYGLGFHLGDSLGGSAPV